MATDTQTLPSPRLSRRPSAIEDRRARAIAELAILDTPPEPEFEGIVALAAEVCRAETALVTFLDRERTWCKAMRNADLKSVARELSFCTHTTGLPVGELLVVDDASVDPRFAANPLVMGAPYIRFYAGAPIRDPLGVVLGAVCVVGLRPRTLDDKQREMLRILAGQVEILLQERLRTRAALRERRMHELVADTLTDAVVLLDPQERIVRFNQAAEKLYGYRASEAIGQHASLLSVGDAEAEANGAMIRASLARTASYDGPHRLRHRDGSVVPVDLVVRAIDDRDGGRFHVTIQRRATTSARAARPREDDVEHLVHANRMATYGALAAGVGHELSNVGQVLQLGIEKMARCAERQRPIEASDIEMLDFVATHIRKHSQHLLSAGRTPADTTEAFDPADVVRGVLAKLNETGRTKHLTVDTVLPAHRTVLFHHRAALEQVVMNLVTNAADAIRGVGAKPRGKTITVLLQVDEEGGAELSVADDGPGMTEELQASIFDPYFTTKPASRGNGLGLPVVAGIVARTFGGKLRLESRPGVGTTVNLTIPASDAGSAAA